MGSELRTIMKEAAARPARELDMRAARERAKQARRRSWTTATALTVALAVLAGFGMNGYLDDRPEEMAAPAPNSDVPLPELAEIFTIRALHHAGLLDHTGDFYDLVGSAEEVDDGWRTRFARRLCQNDETSYSCPPQGSEDNLPGKGDAAVNVALDGNEWNVVKTEGNFDDDDAARLSEVKFVQRREPARWQMLDPSIYAMGDSWVVSSTYIWVGELRAPAPGSRCQLTTWDEDGTKTKHGPTYKPAYTRRQGRTGAYMIEGLPHPTDASWRCSQVRVPGWQPSPDEEIKVDTPYVFVTVETTWGGRFLRDAESFCTAVARDAEGEVIGRDRALVGEGHVKRSPPRTTAHFAIRSDRPEDVDDVDVKCKLA